MSRTKGPKRCFSTGLHNLLEHILAKHFNLRIYCPVEGCGRKFSHATSLRRHIWSPSQVGKHRDVFQRLMEGQTATTSTSSGTSATVICSKCHVKLPRDRFENHVRKLHLGAQFSCPIPGCTQHFTRSVHLDRHIQEKHKDVLRRYVGGMDTH
ncbi:hypothetical protein BDZ89DRAFT_756980 [Hymenopellis radicata]|nr:hypothetical protein BDZ89DRAFT_756980 [Hymenopellis radicata]